MLLSDWVARRKDEKRLESVRLRLGRLLTLNGVAYPHLVEPESQHEGERGLFFFIQRSSVPSLRIIVHRETIGSVKSRHDARCSLVNCCPPFAEGSPVARRSRPFHLRCCQVNRSVAGL